MKNRKESVAQLRKNMPYGSFQKIRDRLMNKGIRFSLQYISRCLDPDQPDYNQIIIEEAIKLVAEDSVRMNDLRQKIELLNNPS